MVRDGDGVMVGVRVTVKAGCRAQHHRPWTYLGIVKSRAAFVVFIFVLSCTNLWPKENAAGTTSNGRFIDLSETLI